MISSTYMQETGSNALDLTVLIADDHAMVREGLKLSLEHLSAAVKVIEADALDSAVAAYRAHPDIDLVLLDLSMPGSGASTALDGFVQSCPDARIVVVSATYDMATVQAAFRKGILGFIPKLAGKAAFLGALRFVLNGGIYIPPEALIPAATHASQALDAAIAAPAVQHQEPVAAVKTLPRPAPRDTGPKAAKLTARQIDVLAQLLDGKANKQICRELNLAMGTVKCHVGAILGALEVNSRAEAIAAADKRGWRQWLAEARLEIQQAA
ncbi:MAG TPA: response regulator transcription factor [Ramlibacter sp.]|uniref:response regulator transcription factor n=1 Tax=Ramlibacter sp. TaxID=1917967 RepID=UPI002BBE3620|nr:response regulator transcription factor [Ramlibacter sp.]HVZ45055.1 response regulator transcription factor [Ramlibacter sp.]